MSDTLDDRYFEWLYRLVGAVRNRNPARSYWGLFRQLHSKEFVWVILNDDNRVEDGIELRREFLQQVPDEASQEWLDLGCSMFEMLIALARRASFEYDRMSPGDWFWHLMQNIGLKEFSDAVYSEAIAQDVDDILETIIFRNYTPTGEGGLFPLQNALEDQRQVELWYQLSEYLLEEFTI